MFSLLINKPIYIRAKRLAACACACAYGGIETLAWPVLRARVCRQRWIRELTVAGVVVEGA